MSKSFLSYSCVIAGMCLTSSCPTIAQSLWPPKSADYNRTLGMLMQQPVYGYPLNARADVNIADGFEGRLVYTTLATPDGLGRPCFVMVRKKSGSPSVDKSKDVVSYLCVTSEALGNPSLSPNGGMLMFQYGALVSTYGGYTICIWNLTTGSITVGKEMVMYPGVTWAPSSSYIGYFVGSDKRGYPLDPLQPPRLHILNVKTGNVEVVPTVSSVTPWSWTNKDTVLFASDAAPKAAKSAHQDENVVEYDVVKKQSTIVVKHGAKPVASPDDNWIAFVPSEETNTATVGATGNKAIAVYDRASRQTLFADQSLEEEVQQFLWDAKSRRLFAFQVSDTRDEAEHQVKRCVISAVDVSQIATEHPKRIKWTHIADFKYQPSQGALSSHIQALSVSHDGEKIYYKTSELLGGEKSLTKEEVRSIDLKRGVTEVLLTKSADPQDSIGLTWQEAP